MQYRIRRWSKIISGISLLLISGLYAWGAIPTNALMKTLSGTNYVFPAGSPYVLDPNTANPGDHAAAIQSAIDAIKNAGSTKGGIVFVKGGTYYLKRTVIVRGTGVTLVGVKDSSGVYPTFTYGDDFVDADYNNRVSITNTQGRAITVLDYPAVIRINGNTNYSTSCSYRSHGIRGFNIKYTGTNLGSDGGRATGVALYEVYHSPVQDVTVSGSPNGPYNGIDTGSCMMPMVRNVTITGVRGAFGIRAGASDGSAGAQKYHGITITAPIATNSTTDLIRFGGEGEFIGANLQGGRIGIDMVGTSPLDDERIGNLTLRSVYIRNTAQQGIRVNHAQALGFTDVQIDYAGAEGIKVCDGLLGGLQMLNLRVNYAGYSAIRVHNGMNINIANAELLNSGQKKSGAAATNLPIAGLYIDKEVTSLSLTGARIGTSSGTSNEDWGVYWSTNTVSTNAPWHTPTIIASSINFFSNITTSKRTNNRGALPTLTIQNLSGYNSLTGYFPAPGLSRPLMEDTWTIQKLPTDPEFTDTWLKPAKGFNWFDLPEIRDQQWIDITSTNFSPRVVDASNNIISSAFTTLVNDAASAYPNGAVLFIPSGKFTNLNTTNPTYARKIYYIPDGGSRLLINKPKIQFLGCGHDVTQIYVPHQTTNANLPPRDHVIKLASGSTNSGIFGMSVIYDDDAYLNSNVWADVSYGAAFRVENTAQVRLANLGSDYGMGGCVSLVNSYDSELYQMWARTSVNNSRPTSALASYRFIGTTSNATHDIRCLQVNGSSVASLLIDGTFVDWNDANNYLAYDDLPELDQYRIEGGVDKVRIDSSTVIQGKNGLTVAEAYSLKPSNISSCRFATDHVQKALNLEAMKDGDFLACWMNGAYMIGHVGDNCSGANIRFSNIAFRGGNLEGLSVRSGSNIDVVNCQAGRTCNVSTLLPQEDRPLAGIFFGSDVSGNVKMIGGMSGWLWYRLATATDNGNRQDWGVVLGSGFATNRYTSYGLDLYGNGDLNAEHPASPYGYQRGLGKQKASPATDADWISDASNYP